MPNRPFRNIVLIRHGRTDWNDQSRAQGWADVPLNDVGQRQVRALADYVTRHMPMPKIITSDLKRCVETAEAFGAPYTTDERLREFNVGELTGLNWQEINDLHPQVAADIMDSNTSARRPQGESSFDVAARMSGFLHDSGILGGDDDWALVSHGGSIRMLICVLLDLPLPYGAKIDVHNASLTVIRHYYDEGAARPVLHAVNFTAHLDPNLLGANRGIT